MGLYTGNGADVEVSPRGTETMLFVEDEEALRQVLEQALTTFGYRVLVGPFS